MSSSVHSMLVRFGANKHIIRESSKACLIGDLPFALLY